MSSGLSPTARALRVLEILQTRPSVTADELGRRLGVTERAARRYIEILREAGIPVESVRGPYGGYQLGRGARLAPVAFTQEEALGLVMAVLDGQPAAADPEADDPVGTALGKVIRALPVSVGRPAAALREHAAAVPDRYPARPDPAITSALVAAGAARRSVVVTYRGESGRERESTVDPWAVVVRHGRWYLLCHSHQAGAIRTYRIDRVRAVWPTTAEFTPPEGLDPVAAVEENLGAGWKFTTRVVFHAPLAEVAPWIRPPMGRLEPHADADGTADGCVLTGSTQNPQMYAAEWLAAVPFDYRVDGGPELRAAIATLATRLTTSLTDPPPDIPAP